MAIQKNAQTAGKSAMRQSEKKQQRGKRTALIAEAGKPGFQTGMISAGLTQLGRAADGAKPAFLQLEIRDTTLSSAAPLAAFTHLQTLLLKGNELVDISMLSGHKNLTHLDVSNNKLTQVLGFTPSTPDNNLRVALFHSNRIRHLHDISGFARLQKLDLRGNRLEYITGLSGLHMLRSLHLSKNLLRSVHGLEDLVSLRELYISHNLVRSLVPLAPLTSLEVLDVGSNALLNLAGLSTLSSLQRLDSSSNFISCLEDVSDVMSSPLLSVLNLQHNPLNLMMSCRLHLVYLLPQVTELDNRAVEAREKVLAANMHGADAEALRIIRRKYFPHGELDDGGGAIPPPAAGLIASAAEEELAENLEHSILRISAWAASMSDNPPQRMRTVRRPSIAGIISDPFFEPGKQADVPPDPPLAVLARGLASVCNGQLELARACYEWVCSHVRTPKREETWRVDVPLFGNSPMGVSTESRLLEGITGAWAERVTWLFCELCHCLDLEAVLIPGYWKEAAGMMPGKRLIAHNHAWAGVKVNGRWRLLDVTYACLHGSAHAAFFVPPEAFIFTHLPLEEHWQLLAEPITAIADWWALPHTTTEFFSRGCRLLDASLQAVNDLVGVSEGQTLSAFMLRIATPLSSSTRLRHDLLDENNNVVASWPPLNEATSQLAFQQIVHGPSASHEVSFGERVWQCHEHRVWVSPPVPGDWYVRVEMVRDVPGAMTIHLEGLDHPFVLHIVDEVEVLSVKVVQPAIDIHDPELGILTSTINPPAPLPHTSTAFSFHHTQLVEPDTAAVLEADRPVTFTLASPTIPAVVLIAPGHDPIPLVECELPDPDSLLGQKVRGFTVETHVPRAPWCRLVVPQEGESSPEGAQGEALLTFPLRPQVQHIVCTPEEMGVPDPDITDQVTHTARDIFVAMDTNKDGLITRRKMLAAFRRNRQLADLLKFPARIKECDGTMATFLDMFQAVDGSKLGAFEFRELAAYMGARPMKEPRSGVPSEDAMSVAASMWAASTAYSAVWSSRRTSAVTGHEKYDKFDKLPDRK